MDRTERFATELVSSAIASMSSARTSAARRLDTIRTAPCTALWPRWLPFVHFRGPQRKTAAQRPPSSHSWVIVITQLGYHLSNTLALR